MSDQEVDAGRAGAPMDTRQSQLVKEILSRLAQMKRIREREESLWEDIAEIVLPRIADITLESFDDDYRRVAQNYDGTGRDALRLWVNGFQGHTTPRNSPWLKETLARRELLDMRGMRKYMQERTEVLTWALAQSNFYDAGTQVLEHGGAIGTGGWTIQFNPTKQALHFEPRHPKQVYIAENQWGEVDTIYLVLEMSWRQIVAQWGEERLADPDRKAAVKNPFALKKVLRAVFPRREKLEDGLKIKSEKNYASIYILMGRNVLLEESGTDRIRDVFWRFTRGPGSPYGMGPGHYALIDLLRAEKISETTMLAADLSVRPPLQIPAELEGKLNLNPHGMTPYYDPRREIKAIPGVSGAYPWGVDMQDRIQEAIRRHYHVDFWLLMSQSQPHGDRTAYETAQLAGEKAAVMGAEVGRYESEFLDPTMETCAYILEQAGLMPDVPTPLADAVSQVKYAYDGPLAQLQKRHFGQMSMVQILNQISLVAGVFPESLVRVNGDKFMQNTLESADAPDDIERNDEEVKQIREQQNAMAAQERQLAMAKAAAELQATLAKAGAGAGMGGPTQGMR